MKRWAIVRLALAGLATSPGFAQAQLVDMSTMVRPIDAPAQVWIEEMTMPEVRDAIKAGKTTAIVGAGAMEQNGPYVAIGKHSYNMESIAPALARKLGNALLAPIVRLTPSGDHSPPTGHMRFAGTISLRQETYEAMLTDIVASLAAHGFTDIVLLGDSGGGEQTGMDAVTKAMNAKWHGKPARVYFIPEFYDEDRYSCKFLKEQLGIVQKKGNGTEGCSASLDKFHDSYDYEAEVATTNPNRIRWQERAKAGAGNAEINTVSILPIEQTIANGWKLVDYRATIGARAIKKAIEAAKAGTSF